MCFKNNAKLVYAVDVGENQLAESLKNDKRIINIENVNFRYMDLSIFKYNIDIIVIDTSFISSTIILKKAAELLGKNKKIVLLIKPQFEVGQKYINKQGYVKDKKAHKIAIEKIISEALSLKLSALNITSFYKGKGNKEFIIYLVKDDLTENKISTATLEKILNNKDID